MGGGGSVVAMGSMLEEAWMEWMDDVVACSSDPYTVGRFAFVPHLGNHGHADMSRDLMGTSRDLGGLVLPLFLVLHMGVGLVRRGLGNGREFHWIDDW